MKVCVDKIFINGHVLVMDTQGSVVEAVAVTNGIIQAIGTTEQILKLCGTITEVVDLHGKTMSPGFIDAHSHFPMSGIQTLYRVKLSSPPVGTVQCIADMIARLKEKVATTPKGEWIIGVGYDDTLIAEQRHLTKDELDQVSTENPVLIVHVSVHMGIANSLALKLMNITPRTSYPAGSKIGKDPITGKLNGFIAELPFMDFYFNHLPALSLEQGVAAIECAAKEYAAEGVTTVQVGLLSDSATLQQLIEAHNNGKMPLRMIVWTDPAMLLGIRDGSIKVDGLEMSSIELKTAKMFMDGSIQVYTAYLKKPYYVLPKNEPMEFRGAPVMTREKLVSKVKTLHKQGYQIVVHGNGDAAIDDILFAYGEAQKEFPRKNARHVVMHCQTVREDQLDTMKELGVIPSFFVLHTYYWGDRHRDVFLGPRRTARIDPVKSALDRGMRFTIHNDTPVTPINQLRSVWAAVNRISTSGKVIGKEQRIPVLDAMRAVTIHSAWQAFEENMRGSIEVGKTADFIILSADPLSVPVKKIKDIKVIESIVGGKTIYKK
jgi:predicted amidohydrolase YtcJ